MIKSVEATIDERGNVRLLKNVRLKGMRRAIVMILDDAPFRTVHETALLSEPALVEDWNRPEEEQAWSHLQPAQ